MSTITIPAPAALRFRRPCPDIPAEQRIAIRDIAWDLYDRLSDAIGEGQNSNPDLAIEIDISPSQIDRPSIYRALKVAEVWRFDGASLVIEQLRPDGTYAASASSRFLPVRSDEVLRWIRDEDSSDELAWELRLREWARTELTPRTKL